jgi:hypothetical protein
MSRTFQPFSLAGRCGASCCHFQFGKSPKWVAGKRLDHIREVDVMEPGTHTGRHATALPSPDFHRLERASFAWRTDNRFNRYQPEQGAEVGFAPWAVRVVLAGCGVRRHASGMLLSLRPMLPRSVLSSVPGRRQVTAECGRLMQVAVRREEVQLAGNERLLQASPQRST